MPKKVDYDKIASVRGLAEHMLVVDPLLPNAIPEYENGDAWISYYHQSDDDINTISHSPKLTIYSIATRQPPVFSNNSHNIYHYNKDKKVGVPTGHIIVTADHPNEAKLKLYQKQDELFFQLIKAASPVLEITRKAFKADIDGSINKAFLKIENQEAIVRYIIAHPNTYKTILPLLKKIQIKGVKQFEEYRPESFKPRWRQGLVGYLSGAEIRLSNLIPKNDILFTAEPSYVGVIPIRVEQYNIPSTNLYVQEQGMAIINPSLIITIRI